MRDQRGEHAQAGALMNDSIQSVVGERMPAAGVYATHADVIPDTRIAILRQPVTAQPQRERPSPKAIGSLRLRRLPHKSHPRRDTTYRRETSGGAGTGTRRIPQG